MKAAILTFSKAVSSNAGKNSSRHGCGFFGNLQKKSLLVCCSTTTDMNDITLNGKEEITIITLKLMKAFFLFSGFPTSSFPFFEFPFVEERSSVVKGYRFYTLFHFLLLFFI